MAVYSSKTGFSNIFGLKEIGESSHRKRILGFSPSYSSAKSNETKPKGFLSLHTEFMGKPLVLSEDTDSADWSPQTPTLFSVHAQSSNCVSRALRWWDKSLKPNMVEIYSGQELVDSLLNAGDRLVVVDFYSPGCGGCKALYPKICQLAEQYPNALFLPVNHENLKTLCHSLHVRVLPFFRFYRGAEGRLCSFSCTNATVQKFKDALAKHGADRCSLGPPKGLDESELKILAAIGEIELDSLLLSASRQVKISGQPKRWIVTWNSSKR